ncbi:hypothetical protein DUI87_07963 [Hirundo rustica rustica]|uniref:Uncharacterized protein n=1 Tax=Hirundo rustica rustica TaxID=333673 RepID=A0A3M0KR64_HIRRU|nr:hypothetical protein DUI87_07963 [Hirundo rustica rustica]
MEIISSRLGNWILFQAPEQDLLTKKLTFLTFIYLNVNKETWETKRNGFIRRNGENKKKKVLRKRQEKKEDIISEGFIGLLEIVAKIKKTTAVCEYRMEKK